MRLYFLTAKRVVNNGRVSFKFMFEGGMPRTWPYDTAYGTLQVEPMGPEEIRPFLIGNPAAQEAVKDVLRIRLDLFRSGKGPILGAAIDDAEDNSTMEKLLGRLNEEAIILMPYDYHERVAAACTKLGIEAEFHHFNGELATS